jgi:hypothetical protein
MKKFKLITLLLLLPLLSGGSVSGVAVTQQETKVIICTGEYSKVYHKTGRCKGLKNCKAEIKTVTLEQAQKLNRRPCKMCYK